MIVGIVAMVATVFGIVKCSSSSDNEKKADIVKAERDAAACKAGLQCWGDKNLVVASIYPDGALEMKMPRFRWHDKAKGILAYIGNKAQFQNGFGAYQNVIYECDFDLASKAVLGVRVEVEMLDRRVTTA